MSGSYARRYFLKSGEVMTLKSGDAKETYDVLGFHEETAVVEARRSREMESGPTAGAGDAEKSGLKVFGGSSKLCGKRVILSTKNLPGKFVIINGKNLEIPLSSCTVLTEKLHVDKCPVDEGGPPPRSHNDKEPTGVNPAGIGKTIGQTDKAYRTSNVALDKTGPQKLSLSERPGDKNATDPSDRRRFSISYSDFQVFESNFYQENGLLPSKCAERVQDDRAKLLRCSGRGRETSDDDYGDDDRNASHKRRSSFYELQHNKPIRVYRRRNTTSAARQEESLVQPPSETVENGKEKTKEGGVCGPEATRPNRLPEGENAAGQISNKQSVENIGMGKIKHFKDKTNFGSVLESFECDVIGENDFESFSQAPVDEASGVTKNTTGIADNKQEGVVNDERARLTVNANVDGKSVAVNEVKRGISKRKRTLCKKRQFIRREIERCLSKRSLLKRKRNPVNVDAVENQVVVSSRDFSCQVEMQCCDSSTKETQTDQQQVDSAGEERWVHNMAAFNVDMPGDFFISDRGPNVNLGVGPTMPPVYDMCADSKSNLLDISFTSVGKVQCMDGLSQAHVLPPTYDYGIDPVGNEKLLFYNCLKTCTQVRSMGNLAIHLAVCHNDMDEVRRQCVALTIRQTSVDTVNDNDMTPLHLALVNGCDRYIVFLLLKYGADVTVTDKEGNNLLHLAVMYAVDDVLDMLLTAVKQKCFGVDRYNYEGFTPLMLCTSDDNVTKARMLLDCGANPNMRDQKSGRTPLFHAVENNNADMVKMLLQYKADTKIRNFFGTSTHEAIFELEHINQEIKSMVIGKDMYQNKGKAAEKKKRRAPPRKDKAGASKKPKLKTVKTLKKLNAK